MEAARLAAERGHTVTLIERDKELGGHAIEASIPDFKQDIRPLLTWLKTQLYKEGVTIRLGTEATPEIVKKGKPDVLIIAVGSSNKVPEDIAKDAANFTFPEEVLLGKKNVGDRVVVAGGGFVGSETALYIAESLKRKNVSIVAASDDILLDCEDIITKMALMMRLGAAGVEIKTGMSLKGFSGKKVTFTDKAGGIRQMDVDSVVLAKGYNPREEMVATFEGLAPQVFKVGDCVQPKTIYSAFVTAWRAVFSF
jgi:2-enoate reductase